MKLILFGGAKMTPPPSQVAPELKLISETIGSLHPKQVLWIPFARIQPGSEPEWEGDWPHRYMDWSGIEFLDAEKEEDIVKADDPLIFISGGSKSQRLVEMIEAHPKLSLLLRNASVIIGESAGSKAIGTHLWSRSKNIEERKLIPGLGIIPDTFVEVHCNEANGSERLTQGMEEAEVKYGIGIDTVTAISFDLAEFPEKWEKIGEGNVEVKASKS